MRRNLGLFGGGAVFALALMTNCGGEIMGEMLGDAGDDDGGGGDGMLAIADAQAESPPAVEVACNIEHRWRVVSAAGTTTTTTWYAVYNPPGGLDVTTAPHVDVTQCDFVCPGTCPASQCPPGATCFEEGLPTPITRCTTGEAALLGNGSVVATCGWRLQTPDSDNGSKATHVYMRVL